MTPPQLPAAGSLTYLSSVQQFTSVGYGAYEVTNGPGGHRYLYNDVRGVATGTLNSITKSWLRISMNPSHGNGGTRYGGFRGTKFVGASKNIPPTTKTRGPGCPSAKNSLRPE